MIHFEIPKNQSSILKVIGVGGGGSNAVNYMYNLSLEGVDFVVCNTDQQSLAMSPVPNKIQLGPHLTQGLGAGANPEIGAKASEESMDDIAKILKVNTKMAFITAGMGGGTGTGGAPVLAKICRDLGILTVGIVTTPFTLEGRKRMKQAQEGIDRLREHVDTILIISNDKLRQQFGNLPFTAAFAKADDVLATAAKCITDVITTSGQMNLDFADVTTVMKNGGVAILGSAAVAGENRAFLAAEQALNSPLLNDNDITGAKWMLLNVTSSPGEHEHTLDELDTIQAYVQQQAGETCDVILGIGGDPALDDKIGVTIIATGFSYKGIHSEMPERKKDDNRVVMMLGGEVETSLAAPTPFQQAQAQQAQSPIDPLAPRLVESKPAVSTFQAAMPASPDGFGVQVKEKSSTQPSFTISAEEPEAAPLQMVIKDDGSAQKQGYGNMAMNSEELEEKRRFEEQKKSLEERAERLRKLSFNIKGTENADDMEHVPAYMRRNMTVEEKGNASAETPYLSGYSVGSNDQNGNGAKATIQTINTFLDGKKPD